MFKMSKIFKVRYAIGYFENGYEVVAIGIKFRSDRQLTKKLKKIKARGWHYDDAYRPDINEVCMLPDYIRVRF